MPLFHKYDILNVHDMYKLEVGVFMYRYFANLIPESFNTFFTKRSDIHDSSHKKQLQFESN